MLQRLVERIPEHVQQVHNLEGGNGYHEGKQGDEAREDKRVQSRTRRAFWKAKKAAKAAGTIDQFRQTALEDGRRRGMGLSQL